MAPHWGRGGKMGQINNTDKINIGVPYKIEDTLRRDAELFEVYKGDSTEINRNHFLNQLILGYYRNYKKERNESVAKVKGILYPYLQDPKRQNELAEKLMEDVVLPEVPKRKGKNPVRLPLKPTLETDQFITEIRESGEQVAQYLCRMFMSYCEKPIYERERIIFRDKVKFLEEACIDKTEICITISTSPGVIHRVIPYELSVGAEEMSNYLLFQEFRSASGRNEAVSCRLCRIRSFSYSETSGTLEPDVVRFLELMKKRGPQYAIKAESESCVRLTPSGQGRYRLIYFARPAVDRIEKLENGDALYYFSAAPDLVFRYFIRFNAGEAEIISPPELRDRIHMHFRESVLPYESDQE